MGSPRRRWRRGRRPQPTRHPNTRVGRLHASLESAALTSRSGAHGTGTGRIAIGGRGVHDLLPAAAARRGGDHARPAANDDGGCCPFDAGCRWVRRQGQQLGASVYEPSQPWMNARTPGTMIEPKTTAPITTPAQASPEGVP